MDTASWWVVDHGGGLTTRYGHLSHIDVDANQQVSRGQLLGKVGSTGRSTGPHLHYEVRINDAAVNPLEYLLMSTKNRGWKNRLIGTLIPVRPVSSVGLRFNQLFSLTAHICFRLVCAVVFDAGSELSSLPAYQRKALQQ